MKTCESTNVDIVCKKCGARFAYMPGITCPRCSEQFSVSDCGNCRTDACPFWQGVHDKESPDDEG